MSINPFIDARALEVAKNAQNKEPLKKKEVNSRQLKIKQKILHCNQI